MTALVADTHAAIWYYAGDPELSTVAREAMDAAIGARDSIVLVAISLVEVTYLVEKRRLPPITLDLLKQALADPTFGLVLGPLDLAVAEALARVPRDVVPDMPDRIIAATAMHLKVPLVSRDRKIRAAIPTIW